MRDQSSSMERSSSSGVEARSLKKVDPWSCMGETRTLKGIPPFCWDQYDLGINSQDSFREKYDLCEKQDPWRESRYPIMLQITMERILYDRNDHCMESSLIFTTLDNYGENPWKSWNCGHTYIKSGDFQKAWVNDFFNFEG